MAILHADDFSGYGTDTDLMLAGVYAGFRAPGFTSVSVAPALTLDPDGVSPGRVLRCGPVGQNPTLNVRHVLAGGAVTTIGVMFRIWFPALPDAGFNGITLMSAGSSYLYTLTIDAAGYMHIRSGDFNDAILYSSDLPAITAQGWYHIEWKTVIDSTTGSFEVRVAGTPVSGLTQSNINTGSTGVGQVGLMQKGETGGDTHSYYVKDFVIWDNSGSDVTDFLGTCILHGHTLTADIALNWTPEGDTEGYDILNNVPPSVGEYIYAEDDPLPDAYQASISPLPDDVSSVKAVVVRYMAAKNDGGDASVRSQMISDPEGTADVANGTARPITIAQTFWTDIFHTDPKTGAPWLPASVNAANVAIDRTV